METPPTTLPLTPLLTSAQAAELLSLDPYTIRRMASDGRLPVVRLSPRSLRFRVEDVEALMQPAGVSAE
jgi:excisionase family DNA binding protein